MRLPPIYDLSKRLAAGGGDLAADYEAGAVLLRSDFEAPHLERYAALTATVAGHKYRGVGGIDVDASKKLKSHRVEEKIGDFRGHCLSSLVATPEEAYALQGMMRETDAYIVETVKKWFPRYKSWGQRQSSWRFQTSENETFHWDFYSRPEAYVRAFVNLDSEPRVWHVGPLLPDYCAACGIRRRPKDDINAVAFRATIRFDSQMDGPWMMIRFPPQSLWLIQSQLVAHRIAYGRRMYALSLPHAASDLNDRRMSPEGLLGQVAGA
jgi:hypothetical protein